MTKNKIKDVVFMILLNDAKARDDDNYLYTRVLEETSPSVLDMSVREYLAIKSSKIPKIETVGRSRRHIQENFPNTCGSSEAVKELRAYQEEEYKEVFANGKRMDQFTS